MITIRRAETDADLEAWRQVRLAVVPNERALTVEEMRRVETPDRLLLLAELDGEVAGSGIADRGETGESRAFVQPRVLAHARRRGVGTALLRALAEHAAARGFASAGAVVEDESSLAFAERFGFEEVGRQVEQVRTIAGREPWPRVPEGIEMVSLAERPDLFPRTYGELALEAFGDMPTAGRLNVSLEDWEREWVTWPEGSFVALAARVPPGEGAPGDEIVGCAGLLRDEDRPDRAEHALTAVRRDWRGRGLARTLKETTIAWAAAEGLRELYTWTQEGNESMRAVNERLGYVTRGFAVNVRRALPLP